MISFDVTNLFTQVLVDEALRVVEERLSADGSLKERTSIPTSQLIERIELCLRSTYFHFRDRFLNKQWSSHGIPSFTCHRQPIHGAPGGECYAEIPTAPSSLAMLRG